MAYAPRVEEHVAAADVGVVTGHGGRLETEHEKALALDEERALLFEERLVRREVDHRRIRFDLSEVGIDRGVEREVGREANLCVEPGGGVAGGGHARRGGDAAHRVRQELDVPRRPQVLDAVQLPEVVHPARAVAAGIRFHWILFLEAIDPAPRVQPPDLVILRRIAELIEGDLELGRPRVGFERHLAVPHGVPARVPPFVGEYQIDLGARGIQVELEAAALVEVAVEADADDVAGEAVAAAGYRCDLLRVVVRADRDIDVLRVEEDLQLGAR